jgi:hypothetical protein
MGPSDELPRNALLPDTSAHPACAGVSTSIDGLSPRTISERPNRARADSCFAMAEQSSSEKQARASRFACAIDGPTPGRPWSSNAVRREGLVLELIGSQADSLLRVARLLAVQRGEIAHDAPSTRTLSCGRRRPYPRTHRYADFTLGNTSQTRSSLRFSPGPDASATPGRGPDRTAELRAIRRPDHRGRVGARAPRRDRLKRGDRDHPRTQLGVVHAGCIPQRRPASARRRRSG